MMKWNIEALMERFSSFSGLSEEEARRALLRWGSVKRAIEELKSR